MTVNTEQLKLSKQKLLVENIFRKEVCYNYSIDFFNAIGGLENPRSSVIGLFRRESLGSDPVTSSESTPQKERRSSSGASLSTIPGSTASRQEGDPLGVLQKQLTIPPLPQPPHTPGQRRQARRGSMLELSGYINHM